MHLAIITAGGAGMFCGSCMHDNTWARALHRAGVEVSLIPLYTPIRVDEENQTSSPIFFGGINTYLNDHYSFWRWLPRFLTRWLDSPSIIDRATRRGISNNAAELGSMTATMLCAVRADRIDKPVMNWPNSLPNFGRMSFVSAIRYSAEFFARCVNDIKVRFIASFKETMFLLDVTDGTVSHRSDDTADGIDRPNLTATLFTVNSTEITWLRYLNLAPEKFIELPLAIDCSKHDGQPRQEVGRPPTVGYFARICPEKGLDLLVQSVLKLKQEIPEVRLRAGGYLGSQNQSYFENVRQLAEPLGDAFEYIGSPSTHAEKVAFYKSIDVFCVPARFQEPKGLYVLEAWANGLPVVLPDHAAFPELIESTGGGLLAQRDSPASIAESLQNVLANQSLRTSLAAAGYQGVRQKHDLGSLAEATKRRLLRMKAEG